MFPKNSLEKWLKNLKNSLNKISQKKKKIRNKNPKIN